mmetsp:Transcript_11124/g.23867  ORF Transcript_11124/g.23867 Transcript_11124/m.23867 type:complete len:330 (-) Transcript_11124:314-1303(-)
MCGLSAVTSMRELSTCLAMAGRLGLIPAAQLASNDRHASPMSRALWRTLAAMRGLKTLSSKWPIEPPTVTAVSLPITWAATMVRASGWVGLTLPGMMEEPGSLSGMMISPIPQRGPLLSMRTSLAIFMRETATRLKAPLSSTMASCAASASNLLGAVTKGRPVMAAMRAATATSYPLGALRPVPTAVPPRASSLTMTSAFSMARMPLVSCWTSPPNSCPRVRGVASMKWVRPVLTMEANSLDLLARVSRSLRIPGRVVSTVRLYAAMCIAVGKVSFEDWLLFTSSFGCSTFLASERAPPEMTCARYAITSFTFILLCVPDPVCQMTRGN